MIEMAIIIILSSIAGLYIGEKIYQGFK